MDHNFKDILHNVNLTEGQIGVILCALETSTKYADSDYIAEVDEICHLLNMIPQDEVYMEI